MPNKYSHALVLSNYEARGLTDFNHSRATRRPPPSATPAKSTNSVTSTRSAPQSCGRNNDFLFLPTTALSHPPPPSDRLRLQDPPSRSLPQISYPQRSRIAEPTYTQTSTLPRMSPHQPNSDQKRRYAHARDDHDLYQPRSPPRVIKNSDANAGSDARKHERKSSPSPSLRRGAKSSAETLEIFIDDPPQGCQPGGLRRRLTNDTAIWNPQPDTLSPTPQPSHQPVVSPQKLPFQNTPTPPHTPKLRKSWESFSLDTDLDEIPPSLPQARAPPLPNLIPQLSPPASTSSGSNPFQSTLRLASSSSSSSFFSSSSCSSSLRPNTSSGHTPRPLPISVRRSSLNATNADKPDSSLASHRTNDSSSLDPGAMSGRRPSFDLDSDLEPLPPDLANDPEFSDLPWDNVSIDPAMFRLQIDEHTPSRASSFDSAAPPPISTGRGSDRPIPAFLSENPLPTKSPPKFSKKNKSALSFLGVGRSSTPKAIPYIVTAPGKPPASVYVSQTAPPSIPTLFPSYRGTFPPEGLAQAAAANRVTAHIRDPNGPREPRRTSDRSFSLTKGSQTSSDDNSNSNSGRSRRSSHVGKGAARQGTEKRLSWFNTESLDRALGFTEVGSKGAVQNLRDTGLL